MSKRRARRQRGKIPEQRRRSSVTDADTMLRRIQAMMDEQEEAGVEAPVPKRETLLYVAARKIWRAHFTEASRKDLPRDAPTLAKPPGVHVHRILDSILSPKAMKATFVPILADLQTEYFEAHSQKRPWKARISLGRNYWALTKALVAAFVLFAIDGLPGTGLLKKLAKDD